LAREENQTQEILERGLLRSMIKSQRILVYQYEIEEVKLKLPKRKINNFYFIFYNGNNDGNVLTLPWIKRKLNKRETKIFKKIYYLSQEITIDELARILEKYIAQKSNENIWFNIIEELKKFFEIEIKTDYQCDKEIVRYMVKEDGIILGTIELLRSL